MTMAVAMMNELKEEKEEAIIIFIVRSMRIDGDGG